MEEKPKNSNSEAEQGKNGEQEKKASFFAPTKAAYSNWKKASWKSPNKLFPIFCLFFIWWMISVARLPDISGKPVSSYIPSTENTRLGEVLGPIIAEQDPNKTGIIPLSNGYDAFVARYLLAEAADSSIDIQTFIWRDDATGMLMYDAMKSAADRGVRVRLLLDDNNSKPEKDKLLVMLDQHPNIEVRLANPVVQRNLRFLGYIVNLYRVNRRMHNKSFTVDNQVTVVGGRNIADEYFSGAEDSNFVDLDVMATGKAVNDVSTTFDRYWNSSWAYPVSILLKNEEPITEEEFDKKITDNPNVPQYIDEVKKTSLTHKIFGQEPGWEWSNVSLISDDPEKFSRSNDGTEPTMLDHLKELFKSATSSLDLVSPYFVPGREGTDEFAALAERGVKVRLLTNSLAATDVAPVHSGYAKRRIALLKSGIQLYELKTKLSAQNRVKYGYGLFGGSQSSLHAKTFGIDNSRIFVGSFNLDPRSANLDTEMGFIIDNPLLATKLSTVLDNIKDSAYEPKLNSRGKLEWHDGKGNVYTIEPDTKFLTRAIVAICMFLPIERLL